MRVKATACPDGAGEGNTAPAGSDQALVRALLADDADRRRASIADLQALVAARRAGQDCATVPARPGRAETPTDTTTSDPTPSSVGVMGEPR
jgi:hypothetical protein